PWEPDCHPPAPDRWRHRTAATHPGYRPTICRNPPRAADHWCVFAHKSFSTHTAAPPDQIFPDGAAPVPAAAPATATGVTDASVREPRELFRLHPDGCWQLSTPDAGH